MKMPTPDAEAIKKRSRIAADLRACLSDAALVIEDESGRKAYESDGLTAYRTPPLLAVLPDTVADVQATMRYCFENEIKVVPRGAGTSLSGGALPLLDGVLLSMARFNRILEIDRENCLARVQPGVTNLSVSEAVKADGLYYAPDPSSQIACTIGGNIAENSGGVHCLKYGMTANNLVGLELVTIEGEVLQIGGKSLDTPGYDLLGLLTGSEGLLGVVTEAWLRLLPRPEGARALLIGFDTIAAGGDCVAAIIAAGIIPAGLEMMDNPAVNAAEDFIAAGYPREAQALLICELDGTEAEIDVAIKQVKDIAESHGASSLKISSNDAERQSFWAGRKAAFPAIGRISPDYYCMDGTIPRHRLGEVLEEMNRLSTHYGLRVANVFHAGDGNLHPLIMYDANIDGELERAEDFGADILKLCVKVGGVLTGEHGVGVEKRDLMHEMFTPTDLAVQQRLKCAFDPRGLLNPGKVFPTLHRCAELGKMHVHKGQIPFPELPRF